MDGCGNCAACLFAEAFEILMPKGGVCAGCGTPIGQERGELHALDCAAMNLGERVYRMIKASARESQGPPVLGMRSVGEA